MVVLYRAVRGVLARVLRARVERTGRATTLYFRVCAPSGTEYAEVLRRAGRLRMGDDCSIQPHAVISDPELVRMGDNVRLSGCKLLAHDGSVNMAAYFFGDG